MPFLCLDWCRDHLNPPTIARAGLNRWLVPPAALTAHLCIGSARRFAVFWLPIAMAVDIHGSMAHPAAMAFLSRLT